MAFRQTLTSRDLDKAAEKKSSPALSEQAEFFTYKKNEQEFSWVMPKATCDDELEQDIMRSKTCNPEAAEQFLINQKIVGAYSDLVSIFPKGFFSERVSLKHFSEAYNQQIKDFFNNLYQFNIAEHSGLFINIESSTAIDFYHNASDEYWLKVEIKDIKIIKSQFSDNGVTCTKTNLPGSAQANFKLVKVAEDTYRWQLQDIQTSNTTLAELITQNNIELNDIKLNQAKYEEEFAKRQNQPIDSDNYDEMQTNFNILLQNYDKSTQESGAEFIKLANEKFAKDPSKAREYLKDYTRLLVHPHDKHTQNKCSQHAKQAMKRNGWKIFAGVMLCLLGAVAIVAGIAATVASGGLAIVGVSLVVGTVTAATCGTTATVAGLATIGLGVSAVTSGLSLFAKQETKTSKTLRNLEAHAQESAKAAAVNP